MYLSDFWSFLLFWCFCAFFVAGIFSHGSLYLLRKCTKVKYEVFIRTQIRVCVFFGKEWKLFRPMILDFPALFRSEIGKNAIEWIRTETTKINVCYLCYDILRIQRNQNWTLSFFKLILNSTKTAPITANIETLPRTEMKNISIYSNKFWLENIHQIRMFSFLKAINFPIFELTMHKQGNFTKSFRVYSSRHSQTERKMNSPNID